jgi:hypothetical protein
MSKCCWSLFAGLVLPPAPLFLAAFHPSPVVQIASKTRVGKETQLGMTISTTGVYLHRLVDHIHSLCKQERRSVFRHDAVKENKDLFVFSYSFQSA